MYSNFPFLGYNNVRLWDLLKLTNFLGSRGHKLLFGYITFFKLKAKYRFEVSENKVVNFFFPSEITDTWNLSTNLQGVHILQVMNGCPRVSWKEQIPVAVIPSQARIKAPFNLTQAVFMGVSRQKFRIFV
jgi:hypothetical protein